jgi:hypothetical protein
MGTQLLFSGFRDQIPGRGPRYYAIGANSAFRDQIPGRGP